MKIAFSAVLLLLSFSALAAENNFVKHACYSGCTFEGVQSAKQSCGIAAQAINILSNEKVQLVASCNMDKDGTYCGNNGFCTFSDVVLTTKFIVH